MNDRIRVQVANRKKKIHIFTSRKLHETTDTMLLKSPFSFARFALLLLLLPAGGSVSGQAPGISAANAHSHNDYLQAEPFHLAYRHRFGSLEADVFYRNDSLFVAHEKKEITPERTFDKLYLEPVVSLCSLHNGAVYEDKNRPLQLLIDLKTHYAATLGKLVEKLAPYEALWSPRGSVRIVISGNTPPPGEFDRYPDYIFFDGRPEMAYTAGQLTRLGLISQSFSRYSRWNGEGQIPDEDRDQLKKVIENAHKQGKSFRFWASPDKENAWETLVKLGADYINTDKIEALAAYLREREK